MGNLVIDRNKKVEFDLGYIPQDKMEACYEIINHLACLGLTTRQAKDVLDICKIVINEEIEQAKIECYRKLNQSDSLDTEHLKVTKDGVEIK